MIALSELGDRHVEYGVLPAHYGIVGEALLYTLATALGDRWTPRIEKGWTLVYGLVSTAMMAGASRRVAAKQRRSRRKAEKKSAAKNNDTCTKESSSSRRRTNNTEKMPTALRLAQITGLRDLRKSCPDTTKHEKVSKMLDDALSVVSETSMTSHSTCDPSDPEPVEESVACVYDSWEKIKRIPNYEEVAGVLLFRK